MFLLPQLLIVLLCWLSITFLLLPPMKCCDVCLVLLDSTHLRWSSDLYLCFWNSSGTLEVSILREWNVLGLDPQAPESVWTSWFQE